MTMKSLFSLSAPLLLLYLSHAQSHKKNLVCACFFKDMCHCFHCTPCCIHIIHNEDSEPVHSLCNLECSPQVLLSLDCTQFFLRPGILCLSYDLIRYRNLQISSDPVCNVCRLVKSSLPLLPWIHRNGNDHIRIPCPDVSFHISAYRSSIVFTIFPAPIIFVVKQRLPHSVIIEKNASPSVELSVHFPTLRTKFHLRRHRSSAFETIILYDRMQLVLTCPADKYSLFSKDLMTDRAASRIQDIQKFLQVSPFSPMKHSYSSVSQILRSSELYLCCCFSFRIISRNVSSLPTTVTHLRALVTAV